MASQSTFDFVLAGGGHAACVVASRLSQSLPSCSVLLVEAGPDSHDDARVLNPLGSPLLHNTELEWNYQTAPQRSLDGRQIYHCSGKLLSGSSAVNYGMWTRGHEEDFNELGRIVDDHRWTYKGILPYFKRTETHFAKSEETPNAEEHGFAGPIHTVPAPEWPLTETIRSAFAEAGVHHLADVNSGQPLGVARSIWTWHQATRQAAGMAYDMSKVHIVANTMVGKILLEKKDQKCVATGIITADGKVYQARKEVIVSCGAFRTPQILMMSGIGNPDQLHSIGVETLVEIPQVGQNLHDRKYLCGPYDSTHSASRQEVRADLKASDPSTILYWKLKHPEEGLAIGSSNFPKKKVGPAEWVFTGSVPENELALAREKDKEVAPSERIGEIRCHYEITIAYGPVGVPPNMKVPMDGSIISTGTVCFLPTSRGSVNIISTDPAEDPVIDPNYLSTEHDWAVLRSALRQAMKVMDTPAAKEQVECQFQPEGFNIGLDSTDEELNARIRPFSGTWYYPGGTAAMGSVVDSECRIYGVQGLRVVDASILPKPLGAHYQAPIYAIAEQASDMIASAHS